MSLPIKKKISTNEYSTTLDSKYLNYGIDKVSELMINTNNNTNLLPRTIRLEDLDSVVYDYINTNKMRLVIDGKKVPTFYLDNDRWGEFSKTWKFIDNDKNVLTPYITVRRIDKQKGTRLGGKYRVPQPQTYRYNNVPILDNGEIIYLKFKSPEPINVDLTFEITLFSKYRVDVNQYDETILRNFASRQDYVWVKGNPFPLHFEGFAENNTIENIDGDKFFVSKYALKILGFIQNEDEFKIVKSIRKSNISINND